MMSRRFVVSESSMTRRDVLRWAGAATVGAALAGRHVVAEPSQTPHAFRFVHMADIHVQPERRAGEGFRAALKAVHALDPRPDFILTGGDLVMDVAGTGHERADMLFDLYSRLCRDSDIPFRQCVGNHDIFGWHSEGRVSPDHPDYGTKMACDRLGLEKPTYSFDHRGWHFCVVNDVLPNPGDGQGYHGGIADEDLDWLDRDLAAAGNRPKVLCAHIPIISVVVFRRMDARDEDHMRIPRHWMSRNAGPILKLLNKHRVNLVLTGHQHQNERILLDGTTHVGQGAVCGAWWKGAHLGNREGFGILDVHPDGTFEHRYHAYGWQAESPTADG